MLDERPRKLGRRRERKSPPYDSAWEAAVRTATPFALHLPWQEVEALQFHPELLRDIFGNPFRPVAVDPAWLTEAAVGIARSIYDDRAFERLPILADALQDAGCEDEQMLSHCREPGTHVRGCWVVDLVLGKG